jgi:RimJ/RimL family protein N-acetyltransferase
VPSGQRWRGRWLNDREVTRLQPRPPSRAPSSGLVGRGFEADSPQHCVCIDTLEGRHIGITNLDGIDRENRSAELGIMIGEKDCWSRGYGTDAILTLLRFAFHEINLNRVWLDVNEENGRAVACYSKCGFVEEPVQAAPLKLGRYSDS